MKDTRLYDKGSFILLKKRVDDLEKLFESNMENQEKILLSLEGLQKITTGLLHWAHWHQSTGRIAPITPDEVKKAGTE